MSLIISVYSEDAFTEINLPQINNADYELPIRKDEFKLKNDLRISMEVMDGRWKIKSSPDYRIFFEDKRYDTVELSNNMLLRAVTNDRETVSLIVNELDSPFHAFGKFRIHNVNEITVGKDPSNDIVYDFMGLISRNHATFYKRDGRFIIRNESPNGTYVNSVRIHGEAELKPGDYINIIGLHMVYLGSMLAIDTGKAGVAVRADKLKRLILPENELKPDGSGPRVLSGGKTIYRRAPRYVENIAESRIEIEAPPQIPQEKNQSVLLAIGPSLTMALPMLLGCMLMIYAYSGDQAMEGRRALFMYSGLVMAVSSAILGVMWTLINRRRQKKDLKALKELRLRRYSGYLTQKTEQIREVYDQTVRSMTDNYPDVNECVSFEGKSGSLWNRNATHDDFLVHRLGTGDVPFDMEIVTPQVKFSLYDDDLADRPGLIKDDYKILRNVPVTVDLHENNLIGIVGGDGKSGALEVARVLAAGIAANNCYTDVKLGFIYDKSRSGDAGSWEFAKWLPHVWSEDRKTRYVASNKEEASDLMYELGNVFRVREEIKEKGAFPKPYYVLFISGQAFIEGEMFSKYIYDRDPAYGLTTVILAERYEELPNKCSFIIENTSRFRGFYQTDQAAGHEQHVMFDYISADACERFARRLSRLQVLEVEEGGDIPNTLTFFEMMGITKPEDLPVTELWAKSRTYENIRGLIGHKAGGAPCYLDVHEKYHGPHGLVAGTTGSGKSETLQTYILSLAVNYSPDDVAFFIIDYKGGGMANLFSGLPHMAGQISNLSGNQVKRAMISIKSENRRRQRIFTDNGVNNINSYTRLYKNGEASVPVPHLFIIIDEFAELKREEPDFMRELISVAQVGRSLGVHLILATQKPSGTVDDNIWSNSRFRLCLRVQDKQDSMDMLHKPDAAYITQAGRCYLQVGNDELYELFQSAYSGAAYDENMYTGRDDAVKLIGLTGQVEMRGNAILQAANRKVSSQKDRTELDAIRDYLEKVGKETGHGTGHQLWLPVLREKIYLDEFEDFRKTAFSYNKGWMAPSENWSLSIVAGQTDDPENQEQKPLFLDFAEGGSAAVCGNIVSGKSTSLQTFAYALIQKYSPQAVNIYALDFSSKMMSAFEKAPHFGGVMYENDTDKIGKFFNMMNGILEERKSVFHGGNYKQFVRVNGVRLPAIFIMIDNYSAFKQKTGEAYEEDVLRLAREGVSNGIYLVLAGGGFSAADITSRIGENIGTVLTLSLKDRYEYSSLLHASQVSVLPETGVKGRGLAYCGKRILEYQTAVAVEAENDYERMEKIEAVCEEMAAAWTGRRARQVPEIPEKPVWDEFVQLEDYEKMSASPDRLPIGYDQANAEVYGIRLEDAFCYGIYGGRQSGKTNLMKVCALSAIDKGADVCIIDNDEKPLAMFADRNDVRYCSNDKETYEYFISVIPVFQERSRRRRQLVAEGLETDEVFEVMTKEFRPVIILMPDLERFIRMLYKSEYDMKGFIENVFSKGQNCGIYFISDLNLSKRSEAGGYPAFETFISYGKGLHLGGTVTANSILKFDHMTFSEQSKAEKAGVATLPDVSSEKDTQKVVIPLVKRVSGENSK